MVINDYKRMLMVRLLSISSSQFLSLRPSHITWSELAASGTVSPELSVIGISFS